MSEAYEIGEIGKTALWNMSGDVRKVWPHSTVKRWPSKE